MILRKIVLVVLFALIGSQIAVAQNSNSSTTTPARPRTSTNTNQQQKAAPSPTGTEKPAVSTGTPKTSPKKPVVSTEPSSSEGVVAAFNALLDGIRHADVNG